MSLSWNLMNYPALHQQRRRRHRVITTLAGLAMGTLLAGISLLALEKSVHSLRLQQTQLQAQWLASSQQQKLAQQRVAEQDRQRQQSQQLRKISQQHHAWIALNQVLLGEVQDAKWRLTRLQLGSGKLELSGWSRDFDALKSSRHRLMAQLEAHRPESEAPAAASNATPSSTPTDWVRQTSVNIRTGPNFEGHSEPLGLDFVWVSPWPGFKPMATDLQSVAKGAVP
ncbi:hypothetical protein [Limnohabitans sp. Rim8]|uniref:hypothetical protein n=1 Tax=Limnohabitans sp. Rim8 TaxID=1100718 RepID=UPI0026275DCF|nr:hypothetical protein [Limnohabitans sp. Rim8]